MLQFHIGEDPRDMSHLSASSEFESPYEAAQFYWDDLVDEDPGRGPAELILILTEEVDPDIMGEGVDIPDESVLEVYVFACSVGWPGQRPPIRAVRSSNPLISDFS